MTASYNDTLARPPRVTTGAVGWARENLFGTWYDALLTVICGTALALGLWFGLGWVLGDRRMVRDFRSGRPVRHR